MKNSLRNLSNNKKRKNSIKKIESTLSFTNNKFKKVENNKDK